MTKTKKGKKLTLKEAGEIRARFAPSPTGVLHIGNSRTALFNYLFAKKNNGRFVLRIEDTDLERSSLEFEKDIVENLKWLGIEWDEGPGVEGKFGPYRQSEKKEVYKKYLEKLLEENKAYYCFCSEEELEAQRQYQLSQGAAPKYNGKCAGLSKQEVEKNLKEGRKSVIRFRVPAKKVEFIDLIKGKIEFDAELIGDTVIAKDLNNPLYNFAVVIDDYEMKISQVIRGDDLLPSTPKQILLQEALGFVQPKYGHLPLILGPDKTKLSKRHGAVSIADYRKQGYLTEALVNMIAFLGWNPGTEKEIYSLLALIKDFSIEKVQKNPAVFNIKKLDFINGFYIRHKSVGKLTELCVPYLIEAGLISPVSETKAETSKLAEYFGKEFAVNETKEPIQFEKLEKIVALYQERLKKLSEISELTEFFFKEKLSFEKNLLKWKEVGERDLSLILEKLEKILSEVKEKDWTLNNLEKILLPEAEKIANDLGQKTNDRGYLLWPFRVALTGQKSSAGPFEIAEVLGKEKTLKRIKEAIDN